MNKAELEAAAKKALEAAQQPGALEAWIERLRMVARSSTATSIEPWDIGAFLLSLGEWARVQEYTTKAFPSCNGCGVDTTTNTHHLKCPILFLLRATETVTSRQAVRP